MFSSVKNGRVKVTAASKRHQRPLHGISLGFFDGALVGVAEISVDAVARTNAFPSDATFAVAKHDNPDFDHVGNAPAVSLVGTDLALLLADTAQIDSLAGPSIEAEDTVRFFDGPPAFDVSKRSAGLVSGFDVLAIERRSQRGLRCRSC